MGVLIGVSIISAGGVAFLTYFGYAIWRDQRQQSGRRVIVLKLRETIALKRHQPRVLYMHKVEAIRPPQGERARKA